MGDKGGEIVMNRLPQDVRIYGEIHVHESVTHGAHEVPRHLSVCALDLLRNVIRRFANNNEIQFDRSDRFGVLPKGVEGHSVGEGADLRDRVQDIPNTLPP